MSLKTVIEINNEPVKEYGFNTNSLVISDSDMTVLPPEEPQKKRGPGRPSKTNANSYTDDSSIVKTNKTSESQYDKGYKTQSNLLFGTITQAEQLYQNIEYELQDLKSHPAKGGKLRTQLMSGYLDTQVSILNTKIQAVKELDNIRHKINDLNLKKYQLDKDSVDENSDKAVMDAYYAFINSSNYGLPRAQAPLAPSTINTGINMVGMPIQSNMISGSSDIIPVSSVNQIDKSFEEYKANLTPIQRKMILDNDPNIKTVVVYDQSSGVKYFDVINVQTGQSVPGVTRPSEILLEAMRIDARNGVAINSNVNQTYPLVIIGSRVADEL